MEPVRDVRIDFTLAELNRRIAECQEQPFFPEDRSQFDELHYLAAASGLPVTEEVDQVYTASVKIDRTARRWFWLGFVPLAVAGALSYISFISLDKQLSDAAVAAITGSIAALSSWATSTMGMIFTGFHTLGASDIDNKRQNNTESMLKTYEGLSYELVSTFKKSPEYGKALAIKIKAGLSRIDAWMKKIHMTEDEKPFELFQKTVTLLAADAGEMRALYKNLFARERKFKRYIKEKIGPIVPIRRPIA